jgi:hypothetical protein
MGRPLFKAVPYRRVLCFLYELFTRPLGVFECDDELSAKGKAAGDAICALGQIEQPAIV